MSYYTLLDKSPLLATSLAERPFDKSVKPILNLVPTKMKFFPIHYFLPRQVRRKVSLFDPVLPEIAPKNLSQLFQHLDALTIEAARFDLLFSIPLQERVQLFIRSWIRQPRSKPMLFAQKKSAES